MINIIDGFYLGNDKPIDSRIVASNSTMRDAISYKYDGLRIFQQDDRNTYIWNESGATWSADISFVGGGVTNYIPMFSAYRGFTISNISLVGSNVGINTNNSKDNFQIDTVVGSSQPFVIHKGNTTMLADNWYNSGGSEFNFSDSVGSSGIKFDNGQLSITNRSANSSDTLESATPSISFNSNLVEVRKDMIFNKSAYNSIKSINALIRSSDGYSLPSTPEYSWANNSTSGIYHPSSNAIGISTNGAQRLLISSAGQFSFGQINAASKIHIDSGDSVASYIKFTAGTTTGTNSTSGFDVGINAQGYPTIISRSGKDMRLSFNSSGSNDFTFDSNEISIYGSASTSYKTIIGSKGSSVAIISAATYSSPAHSISIPSSSFVSVEADYTSFASGDFVRYNKFIASYLCESNGNMLEVGSKSTIRDAYNTGGNTHISAGTASTALNQIVLYQEFNQGAFSSFTGYSHVYFKVTITPGDFSLPS
mgnify:FL=1